MTVRKIPITHLSKTGKIGCEREVLCDDYHEGESITFHEQLTSCEKCRRQHRLEHYGNPLPFPEEIRAKLGLRPDYDIEAGVRAGDLEILAFTQAWSSTALGFGGMGGAAITSATTCIIIQHWSGKGGQVEKAFAWFAGRFAWEAPLTRELQEALNKRRAPSCSEIKKMST